jgi:hypothetical protein
MSPSPISVSLSDGESALVSFNRCAPGPQAGSRRGLERRSVLWILSIHATRDRSAAGSPYPKKTILRFDLLAQEVVPHFNVLFSVVMELRTPHETH